MPGEPGGEPLDVVARTCPVCGASGGEAISENLDPARIDRFSFASRKVPEYMHWRLVTCPACDTLYADPAPPQEVLERAYAGADYDSGEAAGYAATTYVRLVSRVLAQTSGGGGALDIGAGDGAFLRELRRAGLGDVVGVEPSAAARDTAAADVRGLIRAGRFRGEDFEPGRFRLVTAFQTLEHVADPLGLCRAAHELLHEEGALVVVCHDRRAPLNRLLGRRSPIFDIEHLQLFSRRALRALFEQAGFERIEMRPIVNRYPLRLWLRYVPLPGRFKRAALTSLDGRTGSMAIAMPVGNIAVIGYRARPAPTATDADDAVSPP
jgi:SAM-dependent methyltransferase